VVVNDETLAFVQALKADEVRIGADISGYGCDGASAGEE